MKSQSQSRPLDLRNHKKVQDCLFRVPRHGFEEHSEVFRDMFSMPAVCDSEGEEGGSDENPIRIDGVDRQSFKDFLAVLYPPYVLSYDLCASVYQR